MIAVTLGYNSLHVTIGVFDNQELAEQKLVEFGAEWKQFPRYKQNETTTKWEYDYNDMTPPRLHTTKKFAEYMQSKDLDTYSTGASFEEGLRFSFIPIVINEICIGYNDD